MCCSSNEKLLCFQPVWSLLIFKILIRICWISSLSCAISLRQLRHQQLKTFNVMGWLIMMRSGGGHVSAGICQINIQKDHIQLSFIHGAFLSDPQGLLTNKGDRKAKRTIRLGRYDTIPWENLKTLIKTSADFDPYTLLRHWIPHSSGNISAA